MIDRFEIVGEKAPYFVRDRNQPPGRVLPAMCNTRREAEIFKSQLEAAVAGEASKLRLVVAMGGIILVAIVGWVLLVPWAILFTMASVLEALIKIVPIVGSAIRKWAIKPIMKR